LRKWREHKQKTVGIFRCFFRGIVEAAESCGKVLQAKCGDKSFQKLPAFSKSFFICAERKKLPGGLSIISTFFFLKTEQRELVNKCSLQDPLRLCVYLSEW